MEVDDMQNKLLGALALAGAMGGVAGLIVGIIVGAPLPLVGALAGAITIFPFGGYVIRHQRRWVSMAFLNGLMVVTVLKLGWAAAGVAALASFLTFFIAAGIMRCWYDDSDWKALKSHFKIAIGLNHGFQIVDEGKTTLPKDAGVLLGPWLVIIKPCNAVIMERGAKQTEILGPTTYTTKPYEYVKHYFDLREVTKTLIIDRVPTEEAINVDYRLRVSYGIDIRESARLGPGELVELNDQEKRALQQLSMQDGDWKETAHSAVQSSVRQFTCRRGIAEIIAPEGYGYIELQILNLTNQRLRNWHIQFSNIIIEAIEVPLAFDAAGTEAATVGIRDIAQAEAYRDTLHIIADAYKNAKEDLHMRSDEIYREVLRRTLEKLAGNPSVLLYAPLLRDLMNNLNPQKKSTRPGD